MLEDVNPAPAANTDAPLPVPEPEWKTALRRDFEAWLGRLDALPDQTAPVEETDAPDLYAFYEQLAVANTETKKSNRRMTEAFSQWAETLGRFEAQLGPLRETAAELSAARAHEGELPRAHCLMLVELLDRLHRLERAFDSPPPRRGWWGGSDGAWREAWEKQRQGLRILLSHFEELLRKEGVTRIEAVNQPFDPSVMTAVAVEPGGGRSTQIVLEEVAPGYRWQGELLRPAQVKVTAR